MGRGQKIRRGCKAIHTACFSTTSDKCVNEITNLLTYCSSPLQDPEKVKTEMEIAGIKKRVGLKENELKDERSRSSKSQAFIKKLQEDLERLEQGKNTWSGLQ